MSTSPPSGRASAARLARMARSTSPTALQI
jgi:hypothetical protein